MMRCRSTTRSALFALVVLVPDLRAQTYGVLGCEAPTPLVQRLTWKEYRDRRPWLYRHFGIWGDPEQLVAPPPAPLPPRITSPYGGVRFIQVTGVSSTVHVDVA